MAALGVLIDNTKSRTSITSDVVSIDFDVLIDESHEWTSDVTTNEVEEGSDIADHIRNQPDRVSFTGQISNANLYPEVTSASSESATGQVDSAGGNDRIQTTFDLLRKLHETRQVVTVYTKHRTYTDMALTSCNIPRNASIGDSLQFTLQFTKIRIVSTQTVLVPPGISAKRSAKEGGANSATSKKAATQKDASKVQNKTPERRTSVLRGIIGQ